MLEDLPAVEGNVGVVAKQLATDVWGLPTENCKSLLDPVSPGAASRLVREAASQATDTLLVYYAGHGLLDSSGQLHLAVAESDPASVHDTAIPYEWIRHAVQRSPASRRIVILDCCYSARAFGPQSGNVVDLAEVDGTYVLAAAAETALAQAPPGDPLTAFTAALTEVLRTGVEGAPELLDLDTVFDRLRALLRSRGRPEPQSLGRNQVGRLAFAHNAAFILPPIVPALIPASVRSGLDNPHPAIRLGAVVALGGWLASGDPSQNLTAREALAQVADTDIAVVAEAARTLLLTHAHERRDGRDEPKGLSAAGQVDRSPAGSTEGRSDSQLPAAATTREDSLRTLPRLAPLRLLSAFLFAIEHRLQQFVSQSRIVRSRQTVRRAVGLLLISLTLTGSSPFTTRATDPFREGSGDVGDSKEKFENVSDVAFSPDGKTIATSTIGQVRLWDLSGSKIKAKEIDPVTPSSGCLAFSPDGKTLARGISNAVEIINPVNGSITKRVYMEDRDVSSLAFNTNSNMLAIGSSEGAVELWNLSTGKLIRAMNSHSDAVSSVAFSPTGTSIASTASDDDFALVSDPTTGSWTSRLRTSFPIDLAFSPDGKTLAIASVSHDVRLWDKGTEPPFRLLAGHTGWVNSVAFSTDGRLASGSEDGTVRLWEPRSGKQIRKFSGHTADVNAVAFSPDGKILASASEDGTARLWDAASGKQLYKLIHEN
ncbi:caspase family protein [Streptomyces phaeochromogenes]|nr:caspase family protein [Streptomyces phaeochromogenes]WSJ08715.1 caspase family protein [Streptomyces phaeochromogenes]